MWNNCRAVSNYAIVTDEQTAANTKKLNRELCTKVYGVRVAGM